VSKKKPNEEVIVPISSETEEERERIRSSNDRDQRLEREGKPSAHNKGYDEVADRGPTAAPTPSAPPFAQSTSPGSDIHDDWQSAADSGDESPGGDNPPPDVSIDDIGRQMGLQYQDDEPLRGSEKVDARDKKRRE